MRRSWLLIVASLACGSEDKEGAGGGTTGDKLVQAVCRNLLECRLIYDDASQTRQLVGVLDSCEGLFAKFVGDGEKTLFGRDVSKLTLNSEQLTACIERFPHQCFAFEVEEPDDALWTICAEVFEGAVALGAECTDDLHCAGDAYCDDPDGYLCGPGRCTTRRGKGEACKEDNECSALGVQAVNCSGSFDEPGVCTHATAVKRVALNERCGLLAGPDAAERTIAICNDGLACRADDDESGHCVAMIASGQPCRDEDECVGGTICLPTQPGADAMVCAAFSARSEGESCSAEDTFSAQSTLFCKPDLRCENGRCVAPVSAGENESCEENYCKPGLSCVYDFDRDVEVCLRTASLGEACLEDSQCTTEACTNGRCVDRCPN
jgi:hypothetical protein